MFSCPSSKPVGIEVRFLLNLTLVKFILFLKAFTSIDVTFFPSMVEGTSTSL